MKQIITLQDTINQLSTITSLPNNTQSQNINAISEYLHEKYPNYSTQVVIESSSIKDDDSSIADTHPLVLLKSHLIGTETHLPADADSLDVVLSALNVAFKQANWPSIPSVINISRSPQNSLPHDLKVVQLNVLADALSGADPLKGGFLGTPDAALDWGNRKWRVIQALLQHNADIISLQECDHYSDFYAPYLGLAGYCSVFSPKPHPTREHTEPHGNAIFFRDNKIRLVDSTARVLCVTSSAVDTISIFNSSQIVESDLTTPSNSNVVLAHFELLSPSHAQPFHFVLVSTHLKSSKNFHGEAVRSQQVISLRKHLKKYYSAQYEKVKITSNQRLVEFGVIICGDLNATVSPSLSINYPSSAYCAVQGVDLSCAEKVSGGNISTATTANTTDQFIASMLDLRSVYRFYPGFEHQDEKMIVAVDHTSRDLYTKLLQHFCSFVPTQEQTGCGEDQNGPHLQPFLLQGTGITNPIEVDTLPECPYSSFKTRARGVLRHTIDVILASKHFQVESLAKCVDLDTLPAYGSPSFVWPSDHFIMATTFRIQSRL